MPELVFFADCIGGPPAGWYVQYTVDPPEGKLAGPLYSFIGPFKEEECAKTLAEAFKTPVV